MTRVLQLLAILTLAGQMGVIEDTHPVREPTETSDAFSYNRLLGRGLNLGNALEAPREGEWGLVLNEQHFDLIRRAGFQHVRVPIRWSAHAGAAPPYTIEPAFVRRIDWVLDQALSRKMAVVINVHHYQEILQDPEAHRPRLLSIWRQIARRYRRRSHRLSFELLNEPSGQLTHERWNRMLPELLAAIRETNPHRAVIVGPAEWGHLRNLDRLRLPDDRLLIATGHYYEPFQFTHQGAEWVRGSRAWLGTTWSGTGEQLAALCEVFDRAARWAEANRYPLYLGEFGAYSKADMDSRARWTEAVAREAEKRGMSWAYWEYAAGFGAYDRQTSAWREPLLKALLPERSPR